jgi:hypothetical protein
VSHSRHLRRVDLDDVLARHVGDVSRARRARTFAAEIEAAYPTIPAERKAEAVAQECGVTLDAARAAVREARRR